MIIIITINRLAVSKIKLEEYNNAIRYEMLVYRKMNCRLTVYALG